MKLNDLKNIFTKKFGDTNNLCAVLAPGRVNLIGEHTDYNDGFVLPMTIDRAVYFLLRPRSDNECHIYSCNFDETCKWSLDNLTKATNIHWSDYVKGVMQALLATNQQIRGVEGVLYGDVPTGAGLSSSAALEIATAYGLQQLYNLNITPIQMIQLAQKAENSFVGVNCGIMDQFISRLGKKDHALFIDCRSLEYRDVPAKFTQHSLLIANTKVKRELAKSAYNERCAECAAAVSFFQTFDPQIKKLRDVSLELLQQHGSKLPPIILQRARHVVSENQRVLEAITALKQNEMHKFGQLLFASHQSLRDDYAVSCAELDFLVDTARNLGALGARLTGAGFGGSALILVAKTDAPLLQNQLTAKYNHQFGFAPEITILDSNLETTRLC